MGEVNVVVPNQRNLFRHTQRTAHHQRLQNTQREKVICSEDTIRALLRGESRNFLADAPPLQDAQSLGFENLKGGILTLRNNGTHPRQTVAHLLNLVRATNEGNAPSPDLDEMTGRNPAAFNVVNGHRRESSIVRSTVNENHGNPSVTKRAKLVKIGMNGGHQHPRNAMLLEHFQQRGLTFGRVVAATHQHGVAVIKRSTLCTVRDIHEERVARIEHDEAETMAAPGAELPGRIVTHKPKLLDRCVDPSARRGSNAIRAIQYIRNGTDGDARLACNVSDARGHTAPLAVICFIIIERADKLKRFNNGSIPSKAAA